MPDLTPYELLLILGVLLLLTYGLAPVRFRLLYRRSARVELDPFDPDDLLLPREVAAHFRRTAGALTPAGFEVVAGLVLPDLVPRLKVLLLTFANRASKDHAVAYVTYAERADGTRLKYTHVEFVTRYRDGTVVQTNNSEHPTLFRRPNVTNTQFPTVAHAGRLYRLHLALADRHGSPAGKTLRLDEEYGGDAVANLSRAMVDELEWQTQTGYLYHDVGADVYRATWKGAFLMTWPMLWPLEAVRLHRRAYKARRLLAELEGGRVE